MRFALVLSLVLSSAAFAGGSAKPTRPDPTVVESVDLNKYQGKWIEVARLPNPFQKNCFNSTAEYKLRSDGKVSVTNRCQEAGGKNREVQGSAWSTNPPANSKLKVRFFWPFSGDYWVIALDKNYEWVIVGSPNYKFLWILVRKLPLKTGLLQELLNLASERGFDTTDLVVNPDLQLR